MNRNRFSLKLIALLTCVLSCAISTPSVAQFVPPPPPDPGEPGGRPEGGGGRGDCEKYQGVVPIVPIVRTSNQKSTRWGFTASDRPSVWFYFPNGIEAGLQLEWVLRDRSDRRIYRGIQKSPQVAPGAIALRLPKDAPSLTPGQSYRWALVVNCSKSQADTPLIFRGTMRRVDLSPAIAAQISAAKNPVDRATLYAKNQIWYDAVTTLAESPKEPAIAQAWRNLMRDGGLKNVESVAIQR